MTNSSSQPPENESRKKPILDLDEKIAVILAFSTIGAILFWSLGSDLRKGILSTTRWTNSLLSSSQTTENQDIDSIRTVNGNNVEVNEVFAKKIESDSQKRSSKYLDRQLKIKDVDNLDNVDAFTKSTRESLGLAAPVVGGLALGKGKIPTPEVSAKTPDVESKGTTPEVPAKTPDVESKVTAPKVPAKTPQLAFRDVKPDYWAYPFIQKLGDKKLISGFSENNLFEPEKLITRGTMATLIGQAFDHPISKPTKNFTDVSNKDAIATDIQKAVETGFMHGYSDREFRPLENIPRYQVLVSLATGLGLKSQDVSGTLDKFNDIDSIPTWAREQVAAATEAGLVVNRPEYSSNSLKPKETATRAEVAAMIYQALVQSDKLESIDSQYIVKP